MSTHTTGPWMHTATGSVMSGKYSQPFGVVEAGKPNLICGCFGDVAGGRGVAEANARLMAAAPDLLALAQAVADNFYGQTAPLGVMARAAIAKATGRDP